MIMTNDDRDGCRSLVCDSNGIIIAEMVYRCMICAYISDSICDAQKHYQIRHMDNENHNNQPSTSVKPEPIDFLDDDDDSDGNDANFSEDDLVSDSNDNFQEGFQELEDLASASPSGARGGFVTCAVCHITKFYASVQRRYGQFTCMGCAKFFGRFLLKPRKYCCPNLGNCPLDATPRCKACLLQACIDTYSIDEKRMKIVNLHRPVRKSAVSRQSSSSTNTSPSVNSSPPSLPVSNLTNNTLGTSNNGTSGLVKSSSSQRTSILGQQLTSSSSSTSRSRSSNTAVLALLRSTGKKNWGCRKCAGCLVEDCGKCNYCLDKPKFGGANTLKKKCIQRKCLLQEQQKLEQAQNSLRNALK